MPALLLRNGRVIEPIAGFDAIADLLIVDGKVADVRPGISERPAGTEVLDVSGLVVCPGFVDLHTHLRYPGYPAKETIASGTAAAAAGGYTTVCAMANTNPVVDSVEVLQEVYAEVRRSALVRVHQLGAVSVGLKGERLADLEGMAAAGAVAFSDDGKPVWDAAIMQRALEISARLERPISVHEEDPAIVRSGVANAGQAARRHHLSEWPCAGEASLVRRDIDLLREIGGGLHIAHVSCAQTVDTIRAAPEIDLMLTAEVTPHHLCLTEDLLDGDPRLGIPPAHPCVKVNPPLRSREDVDAMIAALADGTIGAIATDHAPHAAEDKAGPFVDAAFGLSVIETALPLLLDLVRAERIDLPTLIERMTSGPAEIFGLEAGSIAPGDRADICVFDPEERWTASAERMWSRGKNTPLLGAELQGRVRYTLVDGRVVYQAGEGR